MQENIFCKNCGKSGSITDKFCKFCGEQINSDSINSIPDESSQSLNKDTISDDEIKSTISEKQFEELTEDKLFVDNITRQFILASRMKRLFARLLDAAFGLISALIPGFIVTFLTKGNFDADSFFLGGAVGIISFVIYQWYLLSTIGQTLGKKYLKIKIVKRDGEYGGFLVNVILREWVMGLIGIVPMIGGIIQLVDVLFIFRDDRKCIHDLIAGTVVIISND